MRNKVTKAVGIGLFTGGLLLTVPTGMAFADNALGAAVNGVNGAVQNVVTQNNNGLQGVTAINNNGAQGITGINNSGLQSGVSSVNSAAQASVPAAQSTLTSANGLVKFAVQGLLGK
jgi:hypothetical protein